MTEPAADPPPCILSYQFATAPSPLQVSGASQPSPGMINAWISAPPGQTIYCNKIIVAVPVGTGPGEFSTVAPALTPNTTWWASSGVLVNDGEEFGLPPGFSYAIFTVTCPSSDHWKIDYQLVFSMTTTSVNPVPDTFPYIVVENSGDSPDNLVQRKTTFTLEKAPVKLYLDNLVSVSASQSSTTVPKTQFTSGEAIKLLWESNGSTFSLYAGGGAQPIWTGPDTSYTVAGGATADTTFTLVAAMDGTPGTVSAVVAVTITNPTATPRSDDATSLTVIDTSTLTGDASLGTTTVGQQLTVSAAATLAGVTASSATVNGQVSMSSATLGPTTVSGAVGGNGSLALASATAASVTVNSWLTGLVARAVTPGVTYTASSDGILSGAVASPSDLGAQCAARISGTCSSVGTVYAQGGNAAPWITSDRWAMWANTNSFALPVPKGSTFSVKVDQRFGTAAPTAFTWYPLARNATLHEVDLGPAVVPGPPMPEPVRYRHPNQRHRITQLIEAIAETFGDKFTPDRRERMTAAIEALVRHRDQDQHGEPS